MTSVDWESPAWKAGLRTGNRIRQVAGQPATVAAIQTLGSTRTAGDTVTCVVEQNGQAVAKTIQLATKRVRRLQLTQLPNPTAQQTAILNDWLRGSHAPVASPATRKKANPD